MTADLSGSKYLQINLNEKPKFDRFKFLCQPYYNYNDSDYREFMLEITMALEPRIYQPMEIIYEELDDAMEILFVMQGIYNVGYIVN